jgi:hypothetical protein
MTDQASTGEKTLSQTYYEEIEALKAGGMKNADAIRATADKHGKTENAVRGRYYQYTQEAGWWRWHDRSAQPPQGQRCERR